MCSHIPRDIMVINYSSGISGNMETVPYYGHVTVPYYQTPFWKFDDIETKRMTCYITLRLFMK
jgi:hypothetical protein